MTDAPNPGIDNPVPKPTPTEAPTAPALEPQERIARTKKSLDQLATQAAGSSHAFDRNIETETGGRGVSGYETWWTTLPQPNDKLRSIDLRTYPDPNLDAAYVMSLSYSPDANGTPVANTPLMLSIESPRALAPFSLNLEGAVAAGVSPKGVRIQDFLYHNDATTVPVREADFTHVFSYRADGHRSSYDATKPQMDVMLGLLADAHVMNGKEKGPKAVTLVPDLKTLVQTPAAPAA